MGDTMKNSSRKNSNTFLVILSIPLIAGLVLIFQLAKADVIPAMNFQSAYPPPEDTPVEFTKPTITPYPTLTQTPPPVVLENGWFLYEDKEAGYSFSYPPEVHLSTSKEGFLDFKTVHIAFKPSGLGYQGMVIELFSNPKGLPIEDIVQQYYSRDNPETKPAIADIQAALNPIMVGNVPAYKSVYSPSMAKFIFIVPMNGKFFCATPVTEMGLTDFAPSSQEMFEKILTTLTFKP